MQSTRSFVTPLGASALTDRARAERALGERAAGERAGVVRALGEPLRSRRHHGAWLTCTAAQGEFVEVAAPDRRAFRYSRPARRGSECVAEQKAGYQPHLPHSSGGAMPATDAGGAVTEAGVGVPDAGVAVPVNEVEGALPVSPPGTALPVGLDGAALAVASTGDAVPVGLEGAALAVASTGDAALLAQGDRAVPVSQAGPATLPAAEPNDDPFAAAVQVVVATVADPGHLQGWSAAAVRRRLDDLRRLEGATTAGVASALAALDGAGGVESDGAPSKAEWLKANTGRTGREAARMARLADNIGELPATAAALVDGMLGADAADTIVKATRDGRLGPPDVVESELLDVAGSSTPEQLRREVRRRQQAAEGASLLRDERRQHALRTISLVRDDDTGMWDLHGRVSDECGARLRTALDAFDHPDPDGTPLIERRRPGQRMADALDQLAAVALDFTLAPTTGGIARPHLSVVVDVETVSADLTRDDACDPDAPDAAMTPDHPRWSQLPAGGTNWGGMLSPQALRRILCDASVSRIVMTAGSQVLDVGRATREWSEPQRRAVNARDGGCRGPSCSRPVSWTQVHHVRWWRDGGATAVDNGIAVCHHCHRLVHDVGWTLDFDPATAIATWTSPGGKVVTTRPHRQRTESPDLHRAPAITVGRRRR